MVGPDELRDFLDNELARLGIDRECRVTQAPAGSLNAVFDLSASYYDLQAGAVLQWTERHVGDYDMNGIVNASDLTPLAQRWKYSVDYRPPAESGVAWWPVGNPRNGGLAGILNGIPGFSTPADHWRSARVDGDANGELNIADITPIATHWRHSVDSYRVYRRVATEERFSLLEESPGCGYSMLRSAQFPQGGTGPDNAWAFRLHFADLAIGAGDYAYYIAPYDRASDSEGAASNIVEISFDPLAEPPPPPPGNELPLAVFSADPPLGDAPLAVQFDATASSDPDGLIVLFLWDWDGDGLTDQSSGASPLATHVYSEPGYYSPRLTVWDDAGATASLQLASALVVSASGLPPPQLTLGASPKSGQRPLSVSFDAVIDSPAGLEGLSYAWDFNGDNVVDSTEAPGPAGMEMTYDLPGLHPARLRITDSRGLSASSEVVIDVLPNTDPQAALSADVTSGLEDLLVSFDASASLDPDGDVLSYSWDLDGDGIFETDTAGDPQLTHLFTEPGSLLVSLLARDAAGAAGLDSVTISVQAFENLPPVAVASADITRYGAPALITFSSTGSLDPDGPPLSQFQWDFDNDGVLDQVTSDHTVKHFYAQPGLYTCRLLVEDPYGLQAEASVDIEAVDNSPPQAAFSATPESGSLPLEVLFDASASTDPDGDPLSFHWEFNYEGRQEFATTGSVTELHTYHSAGVHTCALQVRDGLGGLDTATLTVTASGPGWQIIKVDVGLPTSWVPELELASVEGHPAIAYTIREGAGSQDGSVRFIRSSDALGLSWPPAQVMESPGLSGHRGHGVCYSPSAGRPALSWVRDNGDIMFSQSMFDNGAQWLDPVIASQPPGRPISAEHLDVNAAPVISIVDGADNLLFGRAADPGGQSWQAFSALLALDSRADWHKPELAIADGFPALAFVNELGFDCSVHFMRALDGAGESWGEPQELGGIESNFSGCSLLVIDNIPLLAYYGESGLMFRSAQDSQGASWNEAQLLAGYDTFDSAWIYEQLSLKDFGGVPAILDIHMGLWIANDSLGSSWNEPQSIPDGYTGSCFQHALIDGHPAIAFQQDYLYFAIKLD